MDEALICPQCHQPITPTEYFCPNCGKKIRSPPPTTTPIGLLILGLKTLLLPPLGLYWGYLYLRQPDQKSKLVGFLTIAVTIVETVWLTVYTINTINSVQSQVNLQLQQVNGL